MSTVPDNSSSQSSSTPSAKSEGNGTAKHSDLDKLRTELSPQFKRSFYGLLAVLGVVTCVVLILLICGGKDTTDKMALAGSAQVLFGMIVGLTCVFWGMLLTWLGIAAAYSVDVSGKAAGAEGKAALQSSAPGLVLFVGGMILVGLCLYKPLYYSQTVPNWESVKVPDRPSSNPDFDQVPSRLDLPKKVPITPPGVNK